MALLDDFLAESTTSFPRLCSDLHLASERHPHLPLLAITYRPGRTPVDSKLAGECRGAVADLPARRIVARGIPRFFNAAEENAPARRARAEFDWSSAKASVKEDGLCVFLWHYAGHWHFSSLGCFAETSRGLTFWGKKLCSMLPEQTLSTLDRSVTWIMELVGPEFAMVKRWVEPRLYLLAGVQTATGAEVSRQRLARAAKLLSLSVPDETRIGSLAEAEALVERLAQGTPWIEGVVVRDGSNRRLKIKNLAHVELAHRFPGGGSRIEKFATRLIMHGEASEYLSYFPEATPLFTKVEGRLGEAHQKFLELWERCRTAEDELELARRLIGAEAFPELILKIYRRFGAKANDDQIDFLWMGHLDSIVDHLFYKGEV